MAASKVTTARDQENARPPEHAARPSEHAARPSSPALPLLAVLSVLVSVVVVYRPLLFASPGSAYPLGSDTWGHLFKAQYLYGQLARGNLYPTLLPSWYGGLELFRYWSPFPIYVLAVLRKLSGDIFLAGAWLVPAAAAFGGLSWLFYARRIGWLAALAAGVAWTVWPDHVWVAMVDGNLPRAVATALLPLLFLAFVDSLELRRWPWSGLLLMALLQLVILCHAMIGAMVAMAMAFFCLVYWLSGGIGVRGVVRGAALLALAVIASSWWLLPSLKGGITAISPAAIREAVLSQQGLFQSQDFRALFTNVVSIVLLAWVALTWARRPPLSKALWVCAALGTIITVPQVLPIYMALPLSYLMWPTRFASLTAVAVIGSFLVWPEAAPHAAGRGKRPPLPAVILLGLAVVSAFGASGLIRTGQRDPDIVAVSRELAQRQPGGRVALFDLSHLTSQAAFDLTALGGREQLYRFAYQGAAIGPTLVLMNTALEHHDYTYAVDRAWQCGATDLVVAGKSVDAKALSEAATAAGFGDPATFGVLTLLSKSSPPQAFVSPYRVLAVGHLSGVISMLFPSVETGRAELDSYTEAELARYDTLLLTGVEWRSRERAENLVRAYVRRGGRVVVDLTQFPRGTANDRPSFLGVVGEPVSLNEMPDLQTATGQLRPRSFSKEFNPWVTYVPQGLDQVDVSFSYYGQTAAALGSKKLEGGSVTFVGLNLPYHAYLTRDPEALRLLSGLLGTEPGVAPSRTGIPLGSYRATARGYSFRLTVPKEEAGRVLILPFAALDSIRLRVDGNEVPASPVENLVAVTTAAGVHEVDLEAGPSPLTGVAALVSVVSGLLMALYVVTWQLRAPARRKEVVRSHDRPPTAL